MENEIMKKEVSVVVNTANSIVINSSEKLELARNEKILIQKVIKKVKESFDPIIKKAQEQRDIYLKPLKEADEILKNKINQFALQETLRREAEARKQEEEIRKRKQIESDKCNRKINELLDKEQDLTKQIEILQNNLDKCSSDTEANLLRNKIDELSSRHHKIMVQMSAKAHEIKRNESFPPIIKAEQIKGFRIEKRGEVINKMGIIKNVADGVLPEDLLEVNMTCLNKIVNAGIKNPHIRVHDKPITTNREEKV